MAESAVAASAKGATYLILLQVTSRGLTFALNQTALRFLSPELLGLSAQLELFSITVLYFARESIRVAVQRQAGDTQKIVNFSWLSILFGFPLVLGLGYSYLRFDRSEVTNFATSTWIYGVSCLIELLSEPAFVVTQQKLLFKIRASAEAAATFSKCVVTVAAVFWSSRRGDTGALPFALGQLAYAVVLVAVYSLRVLPVAKRDGFSMIPKQIIDPGNTTSYLAGLFSRDLFGLSGSLFMQNSFKYVLTQGDGILIAALTSLHEQGTYALAANYGGLVARMLFQPIEEIGRNLFAKLCAPQRAEGEPARQASKQAKTLLQDILKLYMLLSLVASTIGPALAPLLLRLVAGSRWADSEASDVLATYCYYIPFLAINGISEAFVAAVATSKDLNRQSSFMGAFFVAFAIAALVSLRIFQLGARGLVLSNCVNMAMRIWFNFDFIKSYFQRSEESFRISSTLPSTNSIALSAAIAALIRSPVGFSSKYGFLNQLLEKGAISGAFGISLLYFEREYLMSCYRMLRPQSPAAPLQDSGRTGPTLTEKL